MWKTYKEKNIPYALKRYIFNSQKYGMSSLNFRGSVL